MQASALYSYQFMKGPKFQLEISNNSKCKILPQKSCDSTLRIQTCANVRKTFRNKRDGEEKLEDNGVI